MRGPLATASPLQRTRGRRPIYIVCLFSLLVCACGGLPRDPEKTTERVQRKHELRVGVVENRPWVIRTTDEPGGVEVALIRQFAATLGANPKWFWGSDQKHMEALERFELDIVISGLDATTPWSKRVGMTGPYFEEWFVLGMPPGAQLPGTIRGLHVAVPEGEALADYIEKKGAIPVRTSRISEFNGPIVGPSWALEKMGLTPTKVRVFEKQHVMAVPPGENGWLKRLSDFLEEQKATVQALLTREAQQ